MARVDRMPTSFAVAVAAKSSSDASKTTPFPPDPNSAQSTVDTVEREITEAGGRAMATTVDVRDFGDIERMVKKVVHVSNALRCQALLPSHISKPGIWTSRYSRVQLRSRYQDLWTCLAAAPVLILVSLVGRGRENTYETLSADAAGESRGLVWECSNLHATLRAQWVARQNNSCEPADLLLLLSRSKLHMQWARSACKTISATQKPEVLIISIGLY